MARARFKGLVILSLTCMCILGFYRACNKLNEEEEETE